MQIATFKIRGQSDSPRATGRTSGPSLSLGVRLLEAYPVYAATSFSRGASGFVGGGLWGNDAPSSSA